MSDPGLEAAVAWQRPSWMQPLQRLDGEVGEPAWSFTEEQVPGKNVFARQRGGGAHHRTHDVLSPKQQKHTS